MFLKRQFNDILNHICSIQVCIVCNLVKNNLNDLTNLLLISPTCRSLHIVMFLFVVS